MKKSILAVLCVLLAFSVFINCALIFGDESNGIPVCVPTEEDALRVGKSICESVYKDFEYEPGEWKVADMGEYWHVYYFLGDGILDGWHPEVKIKKSNAEVVEIKPEMQE